MQKDVVAYIHYYWKINRKMKEEVISSMYTPILSVFRNTKRKNRFEHLSANIFHRKSYRVPDPETRNSSLCIYYI